MSFSRRNLFRGTVAVFAAGVPMAEATAADDPVILEFAIAGGSYHGLSAALPTLTSNELVRLRREPKNPYDRFAIAVDRIDGTQLGYIPRAANQTLARLMDAGWRTEAIIAGFVDRASLTDIAFTSVAEGEPRVRVILARHRRISSG